MGWTDIETVEKHLLGLAVSGLPSGDVIVTLNGTDETQLPHHCIEPHSEMVASMLRIKPEGPSAIVLNDYDWNSLGWQPLLEDTVCVAYSSLPYGKYIENTDYAVDYENGRIKRLPLTSITNGSTVYAWFMPLTVYTRDVDYILDTAKGTIRRKEGTSISDPARLLVRYNAHSVTSTSSLISTAITEAEDKIAVRLRDGYTIESKDQGLKTGATELTLSIICDDLALSMLNSNSDPGADDRARRFMDLSARYESKASATLSRFLTQPLQTGTQVQSSMDVIPW